MRKGVPENLAWENSLTENRYGSLIPCKPVPKDKFQKSPNNPSIAFRICEKPVALMANDILMYVFTYIY